MARPSFLSVTDLGEETLPVLLIAPVALLQILKNALEVRVTGQSLPRRIL